jgi:hypothetical protein
MGPGSGNDAGAGGCALKFPTERACGPIEVALQDRDGSQHVVRSFFGRAIDLETYERQRDRLREELTQIEIDRHRTQLEEFDVEGILAFAERVLPKASELWVHASLDQRQRLQQSFFPDDMPFDGRR